MISKIIAFSTLVFFVPLIHCEEVKVTIKLGSIRGFNENIFGNGVNVFLGIPYASPPIGNLRFRKPQPITEKWTETLDATKWPKICMQDKFSFEYYSDTSEDCLYLNVWTPSNLKHNLAQSPKPVMVFIHGGSLTFMGTSHKHYNPVGLSSFGDVVVVTMNYRLGAFGFLSSGSDDAPGNVGLYDQALALEWVQENIAYFGGDPKNVTLFGLSAGAWATNLHIISPVSQDMFNRAIVMSGTIFHRLLWDSYKEGTIKTLILAKLLGCKVDEKETFVSEDHMECLRKADATKIVETQFSHQIISVSQSLLKMPFMPIFGEAFLPMEPKEMINHATFNDGLNVLAGTVANEGYVILNELQLIVGYKSRSDDWHENLRDYLANYFNDSTVEQVNKILNFYYKHVDNRRSDEAKMTYYNALGDIYFNCQNVYFADAFSKVNDFYQYYFDYALLNEKDNIDHCDLDKVCHGNEISLTLGTVTDPRDIEVGKMWMKIVSDFAKTGATEWHKHEHQSKPYYHFTGNKSIDQVYHNFRIDACKMWKPLLDKHY